MNGEDALRLQGAFVQWKNIQEGSQLSSLSTIDSFGSSQGDSSQQAGGFRVSRTSVRHIYNVPTRKRKAKD